MSPRLPVAAFFVLLAGAALTGQGPAPVAQQTPTFKVQVDYVEVDARVVDRQGRFVRDLTKDDFQVFEDGKAQTISALALVDIPVEHAIRPLFASQPIEPDVATNARPFDGRVYVLVLDDLHTAFERSPRVKIAARKFIEENLGANDLMAVVHVSGRSDDSQEFTSRKGLLLASVDRFVGKKLRSATLERFDTYSIMEPFLQPGDRIDDPLEDVRGFNAQRTIDQLTAVADWFGGVRGRKKTILFMSEGIDYDVGGVFRDLSPSRHYYRSPRLLLGEMRDLIRSATRANVVIYSIDPRGLTGMVSQNVQLEGVPPSDMSVASIGSRGFQDELWLAQTSLRSFAEETGGFAAINRNTFTNVYARIVEENSSYYVLAYYPPNPKRDGKFHKIEVRVNRPGLVVHARRGYGSPTGKAAASPKGTDPATAQVREVLRSPLPVSGLTMHVFAAAFKGTAPNASVLVGVELRGRDMKLGPKGKITVGYLAVDAKGKVHGANTLTLTTNLKPKTKARVKQGGLRVFNRLDLPPGHYQVRVGAHESDGDRLGSILYDLEVPDFNKGPLVMSGLVLTLMNGSAVLTARPDEELKQVLPASPIALRSFTQNDEIALFTEVYDNVASTPHKVDITTTVTADAGTVVFKTDEARDSADLQGERGGFGHTMRIPLKDIPPGSYVLKVEARSRLGQGPTVNRQVQFTVVAASPRPSR